VDSKFRYITSNLLLEKKIKKKKKLTMVFVYKEDPDEIEPEIDADDLVPGLSTGEHLANYKLVFPSRGNSF
jgi:hypothetical protein